MKIIFLDIDGVMNNRISIRLRGISHFDPNSVYQLCRILEKTEAKIVISSTWRYMRPYKEMDEFMMYQGCPPDVCVGQTPFLNVEQCDEDDEELNKQLEELGVKGPAFAFRNTFSRGSEIQAWLDQNPSVTEWVALDDAKDMNPLDLDRVVTTKMATGLQRDHADAAIRILNGEPNGEREVEDKD